MNHVSGQSQFGNAQPKSRRLSECSAAGGGHGGRVSGGARHRPAFAPQITTVLRLVRRCTRCNQGRHLGRPTASCDLGAGWHRTPGGLPGPVSFRTLYIEPDASPQLPKACRVMEVSDLLRSLIIESVAIPLSYDVAGRDGCLMQLILHEIETAPVSPLYIRMPQSRPLRRMCEAILKNPSTRADIDHWALKTGMSRRTLTRHFRLETGISIATWIKQARLVEAMSRRAEGASITTVAFEVGYESSSAFGAMFRRTFGCSPTRY